MRIVDEHHGVPDIEVCRNPRLVSFVSLLAGNLFGGIGGADVDLSR